MTNRLAFQRRQIYSLKRSYGREIALYTTAGENVDLKRGFVEEARTKYTISRAIVLPEQLDRRTVYDLAFISANRNFTSGATFDQKKRNIIIDRKDLSYMPKVDDYVIMDHTRYNILKVDFPEHGYTCELTVVHTVEETPNEIVDNIIVDRVSPSDEYEWSL